MADPSEFAHVVHLPECLLNAEGCALQNPMEVTASPRRQLDLDTISTFSA
jgi:hypothetical protein